MLLRTLVPTLLLVFVSPASAEPPRCVVTQAVGKPTSLEVTLPKPAEAAELHCKMDSRKIAEKWVETNRACEPGKAAFKFTIAFTADGTTRTFELSGYCPQRR